MEIKDHRWLRLELGRSARESRVFVREPDVSDSIRRQHRAFGLPGIYHASVDVDYGSGRTLVVLKIDKAHVDVAEREVCGSCRGQAGAWIRGEFVPCEDCGGTGNRQDDEGG